VNRVKAAVALLLATVWLPASSHALLEHFELIHQVHDDHDTNSQGSHEHDTDSHDAADGKCAPSSTQISVPICKTVATPFFLATFVIDLSAELHAAPHPSGRAPPGTAPPQLSHRWQFSLRTALLAREPSLIS
jgi:hypothetical protein